MSQSTDNLPWRSGPQSHHIAIELSAELSPLDVLAGWDETEHVLGLISSRSEIAAGRYSYVMTNPKNCWSLSAVTYGDHPFEKLKQRTAQWENLQPIPGLPPFQGGVAGLLGYELNHAFEQLPEASQKSETPVLAIGEYAWVIAWDHHQNQCWLIVSNSENPQAEAAKVLETFPWLWEASHGNASPCASPMASQQTAASSNRTAEEFQQSVQAVREYIAAGDLFQANIAHQLRFPVVEKPLALFQSLCLHNPAPFSGYLKWEGMTVMSASPERFLLKQGNRITTCPIKGTRRLTGSPEADLFQAKELQVSEKDRAENVMIVDLLRNDLSRVCQAGSIQVPALCRLETFATVQHLVSEIQGRLKPACDWWDLLEACWPGGSITGAPKIRAMEIITELEQLQRGPYCGSLFYLGYDGSADSNLLIRTFVQTQHQLTCHVGGGITWRSQPEDEYQETLDKAAGMIRAYTALTTSESNCSLKSQ